MYLFLYLVNNLFTIRDGQLHQVFSGFYRNAWYYLGNGRFLNRGSGGASLSILGEYHLDGNGNLVFWHRQYDSG